VQPRRCALTAQFVCETSEGNVVSCTDGWLAIDSHGYPYPVSDAEFRDTYRPIIGDRPAASDPLTEQSA